jgi:hypothetical protein
MTNHPNENQSTINELITIQNENLLITATCETILDAIFDLANRTGAEEDFHAETTERIIKQLHDIKTEAENLYNNARIGVLKANLIG